MVSFRYAMGPTVVSLWGLNLKLMSFSHIKEIYVDLDFLGKKIKHYNSTMTGRNPRRPVYPPPISGEFASHWPRNEIKPEQRGKVREKRWIQVFTSLLDAALC